MKVLIVMAVCVIAERKEVGPKMKLQNLLNTSYSVMGQYERNNVHPIIGAVNQLDELLDTTVA